MFKLENQFINVVFAVFLKTGINLEIGCDIFKDHC